jgi:hypothetical protein
MMQEERQQQWIKTKQYCYVCQIHTHVTLYSLWISNIQYLSFFFTFSYAFQQHVNILNDTVKPLSLYLLLSFFVDVESSK